MERNIVQIMKLQRDFYGTGATKQYGFRMTALKRLVRALEEYEDELVRALKEDLNKSASESYMAEIGLTKTELHHVMKNLRRWMKAHKAVTPMAQLPSKSFTVAEPYGVVLIMAPWNYPVLLCLEPLIDAIAAGNCVILKPSAYAPAVSAALKAMLKDIYPEKLVSVVEGGREENAALLEQRFDYIFFTGGVTVGKLVLKAAAEFLTPVTLELGGKSPCIVDETADLKTAARRIAFGKLLNAGQTCVAPDYLLVHKSIKEELIEGLREEFRKMLGDDPLSNGDYPNIINRKHFDRIIGLIQGERAVIGGGYSADEYRLEPTVLDAVTLDSPVMKEEIFGPVLPVLTYETKEEMKETIESFEKPLAFYLFTENKKLERWALSAFSFGGGCINDTIIHLATPHMPFGGVGNSGMGGYHGTAGFETFSHRKSIVRSESKPDLPFRYHPYSGENDRMIRMFLK